MGLEENDEWAVVGSFYTARQAHEAGLAVLACGHPYWVRLADDRFLLVVMGEHAQKLKEEIDITAARNRFWPHRQLDLSAPSLSKWPSVGFVAVLILVFWLQNRFPGMVSAGANKGIVWEGGEWWRAVTAITLHADIGHLAGNLLGISIFAYLACRYVGNGLAWLLVVVAAALSNFSNAWLHAGESYSSLGASTAVFGALGLLAGYPAGVYLRAKVEILTRDWLIPFFGGCIAFAWMGGGEFPTDVPGHFWAFGYGTGLAVLVGRTGLPEKLGKRSQGALLLLALLMLGLSWFLALQEAARLR